MRIVLLRHGRPHMPEWPSIPPREMGRWIDAYNRSGIDPALPPPAPVVLVAQACRLHVCSDLPRSLESILLLGLPSCSLIEPIFRELELPHGLWPVPRCHPTTWVTMFRVLWFLGYRRNSASLEEERQRAQVAANKLVSLAHEHSSVLLAGHGMMNQFIARELLSSGWQGPKTPARHHWDFGVYEFRGGSTKTVACKAAKASPIVPAISADSIMPFSSRWEPSRGTFTEASTTTTAAMVLKVSRNASSA
jgi:broad specificity phosphatase PhoE